MISLAQYLIPDVLFPMAAFASPFDACVVRSPVMLVFECAAIVMVSKPLFGAYSSVEGAERPVRVG